MRRALAVLYSACGYAAGACLVAMLAMITLNIAGGAFGFFVPGLDAYAGYLLAATLFLALAPTLKAGEHIRVTLFTGRLGPRAARTTEIAVLVLGVALSGMMALALGRSAWNSWRFGDVSQMSDATPLWIPQSVVAFGALVFLVSLIEETVDELRGQRIRPQAGHEPARIE
ncbi:MAG TPA: TRAP transporter small permease [Azospirillaceae bacterium]|nr:TRAP transporter small permease [Azospirillaceae bacterium]